MADEEKQEQQEEVTEGAQKKKGKGKLIIILALVLVLAGGGFAGYKMMAKTPPAEQDPTKQEVKKKEEVPVLFPLEPFVVNLADKGRYLKLTIQLELVDKQYEEIAQQKVPPVRDAIITLVSSKTSDSVSTPEGKFQLKDEILMRVNAAIGEDIFKNVYFTEFVMQ